MGATQASKLSFLLWNRLKRRFNCTRSWLFMLWNRSSGHLSLSTTCCEPSLSIKKAISLSAVQVLRTVVSFDCCELLSSCQVLSNTSKDKVYQASYREPDVPGDRPITTCRLGTSASSFQEPLRAKYILSFHSREEWHGAALSIRRTGQDGAG